MGPDISTLMGSGGNLGGDSPDTKRSDFSGSNRFQPSSNRSILKIKSVKEVKAEEEAEEEEDTIFKVKSFKFSKRQSTISSNINLVNSLGDHPLKLTSNVRRESDVNTLLSTGTDNHIPLFS